ncbi:hypothetical protein K432DRAFT_322682 [Lepidopterella palustris CBS 459.81]|uniref:Uncharacterized protein n=1 Tax=Lepidopterella palustris CBS 459.81 TaxID=1314670 RepID=A0A8E2JI62_9PEZI|nr:hypothetical protein K432DRAFT_322682 [Lepidopterella palustris CBS 459.81]
MTTSLAILPQRQPPLRQPEPGAPRPKPKLQLNTQQIRTFGKGSSLRLETLSAVSPTIRNTFTNAYDAPVSAAPALGKPSKPRLSIDSSVANQAPSSTSSVLQVDINTPSYTPNSASTFSSGSTSASSSDSATIRIPYKLTHNLPSILSNSPVESLRPRRMTASRPMFPAAKKVSFRTPLEEEITTVKYTLAHSDIESSTSSTASTFSVEPSDSIVSSESERSLPSTSHLSIPTFAAPSTESPSPSTSSPSQQSSSPALSSSEESPRLSGPKTGDKRDSSSSESDSEDSCPETPVAGRRKRRREWVWTLGPIGKNSSSSEMSTSDDSS